MRRAPRYVRFSMRSLKCRSGGADSRSAAADRAAAKQRRSGNRDARDRARYRDDRARSLPGASAGRGRLHRARQPHPERPEHFIATSIPSATCRPRPFAVHGLSGEFLKDKPCFAEIVEDLIAFIGDAPLVAHNALFDLGFLNAELERVGKGLVARERLIDTLLLARRKHPAGPNRLDDLCARYGIDNSRRTKHGALLDAELLAEVYLELIGARQAQLILVESGGAGRRKRDRRRGPRAAAAAAAAAHRERARGASRLCCEPW